MNLNEAKLILKKAGYLCEDAYMDAMDDELDEIQADAARTTSKGYKMTYLDSFDTAKQFAKYCRTPEYGNATWIFTHQSHFNHYQEAGYKTFVFTAPYVDNPGEPKYIHGQDPLNALDKFGSSLFIIHVKGAIGGRANLVIITRYAEYDANGKFNSDITSGTNNNKKFQKAVLNKIVSSTSEFTDLIKPYFREA